MEPLVIKIIFFLKPRVQIYYFVLFFSANRIRTSFNPRPELPKETQESIKYFDQLMS